MKVQGIILFFASAACCCLEITVNVSVLYVQKNSQLQFWMLICHGLFGIGGLVGPIFVFMVMGICIALIAPFYLIMPSPQNYKKVQQQVSKQGLIQQIKNAQNQEINPAVEQHKPQRKLVGRSIQILVSFMFTIYIGLECSYGSWIASYAVLQNIASKQYATRYSSIFWISITIFRFVTVCLPFKSMKKLFILGYGFVVMSSVTILLLMIDYKGLACVFSAISFGMCYSSMFPLLLAIPSEYNLQVSTAQSTNFMMWSALGEAVLATMVGYCMEWFNNEMLFYLLFLMGAAFLISTHIVKGLYKKQSNNSQLIVKGVQTDSQTQQTTDNDDGNKNLFYQQEQRKIQDTRYNLKQSLLSQDQAIKTN